MRLIDADRFEAFCTGIPKEVDADSFMRGIDEVIYEIDNAPTVDAVEVVRCKDCTWFDSPRVCLRNGRFVENSNWYCADGERREEEDEHRAYRTAEKIL